MKVHHVVVAASAALISLGAIAGGEQQSRDPGAASSQEAATVRDAQDRLRAEGYAPTPQGLREFQQAKGIEPSGKLDSQTLAALGVEDPAAGSASSGDSVPRDKTTRN